MQGITGLGYEIQYQPLVPSGGVNNYQKAAELLKEFGRNGDTYIVHAAQGETMLPMEVLKQNPRLKKMIWKQLADMGVDPERYVVGNKLNSINPVTGQPEFFFKRIFKSVKRVVKDVAKVAKKAAPIVLAVAAPFMLPALPVAASVGIGSLAGGLISGQSFKDSLKNAAISAGLAGVGNLATGGSFFGTPLNPKAGLGSLSAKSFKPVNPFAPTAPITGVPTSAAPQNVFKAPGVEDYFKNATELVKGAGDASLSPSVFDTLTSKVSDLTGGAKDLYSKYISPSRASIQPTGAELSTEAVRIAQDKIATAQAVNNQLTQAGFNPPPVDVAGIQAEAIKTAQTNLAPGMFTKYGPAVGAGIVGLNVADAATGGKFFGMPEQEGIANQKLETGFDLYKTDPSKYGFSSAFYGSNPYYQDPKFLSPALAAEGGEIVGPGTGTSDSIPAMLSDGEFVMTAKAVEGIGNGNRSEGAKKMYAMMRKFENARA
mgnify:CR=1 FL=1|jgi:hypothetical protein